MKLSGYLLAAAGATLFTAAASAAPPPSLPMNRPVTTDGIEAVCTGIGLGDEDKLRWNAYPLKVVVAGKGGQFLAGETVSVLKDGKTLTAVYCDGPWVLFRLAPGRYRIDGALDGGAAGTAVVVPAKGQGRAILRFPDSGGAISPEHKP